MLRRDTEQCIVASSPFSAFNIGQQSNQYFTSETFDLNDVSVGNKIFKEVGQLLFLYSMHDYSRTHFQ